MSEYCGNTTFSERGPSDGWVQRFLRRNPNLHKRKTEALSTAAGCVTVNNLRAWLLEVIEQLRKEGYIHIFLDPRRILNCDESGFLLLPTGYAFIEKGTRAALTVTSTGKTQMTVMFCFSANGETYKPHILYDGIRMSSKLKESLTDDVTAGMTPSGWMNAEAFIEWLEILVAQLKTNNVQLPVILFLDGHSSHETLAVKKKARELGVILIKFYPNATQDIQPADKVLFKPIKSLYKKTVTSNQMHDPNFAPSRLNFAGLISRVKNLIQPELVKKSFEVTGLYPLNPDRIEVALRKDHETQHSAKASTSGVDVNSFDTSSTDTVSASAVEYNDSMDFEWSLGNDVGTIPIINSPDYLIPTQCDPISTAPSIIGENVVFDQITSPHAEPDTINVEPSLVNPESIDLIKPAIDSNGCESGSTQLNLSSKEINPMSSDAGDCYRSPDFLPYKQMSSSTDAGNDNESVQFSDKNMFSPLITSTPVSNYKLQTRKFQYETPHDKFVKIWGKDTIVKLKSPTYLQDLEKAGPFMPSGVLDIQQKLLKTYQMLKEDDEYLKSPASLPIPKPPQRKGKKLTEKKSFILTTDSSIAQSEVQEVNRKRKLKELDDKKKAKQQKKK